MVFKHCLEAAIAVPGFSMDLGVPESLQAGFADTGMNFHNDMGEGWDLGEQGFVVVGGLWMVGDEGDRGS